MRRPGRMHAPPHAQLSGRRQRRPRVGDAAAEVTWAEACEFCERLSDRPEESERGRTYRLPTEAEWEYACRAGTTTRWNFGDAYCVDAANCDEPGEPVGRFSPNALGLHDMHFGSGQWCADWYRNDWYSESPMNDPAGPDEPMEFTPTRVVRGGTWNGSAQRSRSAARLSRWSLTDCPCNECQESAGFRVVCEVSPPRARCGDRRRTRAPRTTG